MTRDPAAAADALVVGGGPAGAAVAIRLAGAGHRVVVVERSRVPRPKPCGDLLTPRAVHALDRIGIDADRRAGFHRVDRVRITCDGRSTATAWPAHGAFPDHGLVARRELLDQALLEAAVERGATVLDGHEAVAPIVERGFVRGAQIATDEGRQFELRSAFTVVADGANSRFGRAIGTFRQPTWPYALAYRSAFPSRLHDAPEVELVTDLRGRDGTALTGFGWLFPRGDGTVNAGVLLMSTSATFRVVNPTHLLDGFVARHADRWQLDVAGGEPPVGGRLPLGLSVGPSAGPTYLVVGDAAAAGNPLSGAGIEYALETGTLAGEVVDEALSGESALALQRYRQLVEERYGAYYKVGRLADRVLGRPALTRRLGRLAAGHRGVADAVVRLAGNELRTRRPGVAELGYRLGRALSLVAPDS